MTVTSTHTTWHKRKIALLRMFMLIGAVIQLPLCSATGARSFNRAGTGRRRSSAAPIQAPPAHATASTQEHRRTPAGNKSNLQKALLEVQEFADNIRLPQPLQSLSRQEAFSAFENQLDQIATHQGQLASIKENEQYPLLSRQDKITLESLDSFLSEQAQRIGHTIDQLQQRQSPPTSLSASEEEEEEEEKTQEEYLAAQNLTEISAFADKLPQQIATFKQNPTHTTYRELLNDINLQIALAESTLTMPNVWDTLRTSLNDLIEFFDNRIAYLQRLMRSEPQPMRSRPRAKSAYTKGE